MLDATMTGQLRAYLERLRRPIELQPALDDSPTSAQLAELLREIAALNPQVTLAAPSADASLLRPSFGIAEAGQPARVRFAGLPLGHEFTSLVLALLHVGGHPPKIDDETAARARALGAGDAPRRFRVFMSLHCQSCPDTVQSLNTIAALNPNVSVESIDGALFQAEVERAGVMAVPTVFLDGAEFGQGRMEIEQVLARLDAGSAARDAARLAAKAPYDMLIVGGGPAGAAAAVYAARKGIRTGVVAERFGGQTLDTMGIDNFVSVPHTEGPKFAAALEAHVRDYDVDVIKGQRAAKLHPAAAPGGWIGVELACGATLRARSVVIATGARWREMGVPGEQQYKNRGVAFCPHCDGPLYKGKDVAVIGGGNSGVEAAIDLAGIVRHVTVFEFMDQLKADAVLVDKLRSLPNVDVHRSAQTTEVLGDGSKVQALAWQDRASGQARRLDLDGVFVQIGLVPNTEWLRETIELSRHGEILVDARGATSVAGVFAAGDATTTPFKQIVIAAGEGAKAALAAFDHLIRTPAPADAAAAATAAATGDTRAPAMAA